MAGKVGEECLVRACGTCDAPGFEGLDSGLVGLNLRIVGLNLGFVDLDLLVLMWDLLVFTCWSCFGS